MSNNRNLPTYQRSVKYEVTQMPDEAGTANILINSFRDFTNTVSKVAEHVSTEEAKEQRSILKNNVSASYKAFALEALRNKDAQAGLAGYVEQSQMYAKGLNAQTTSTNRSYVGNMVDYYSNEHMYELEKTAIQQSRRADTVAAYDRMNQGALDVTAAINNANPALGDQQFVAADALIADNERNLKTDAVYNGIDPARVGDAALRQRKHFTELKFLKLYQDNVKAGTGSDFLKKVEDSSYIIKDLDPLEKKNLVSKMIGVRDQHRAAQGLSAAQLNTDIKTEVSRVSDGGFPNQETRNKAYEFSSKLGEKYDLDVEVAQASYSAKQATMYKTPAETSAYLEERRPTVDSATYEKDKKVYDGIVKAVNAQRLAFKINPMTEILKDPSMKEKVDNYETAYNADAVGTDHRYTPFNSEVPKPWQAAIDLQLKRGLTLNGKGDSRVRILENAQVPEMVNSIMIANGVKKIQLMNKWRDEYGGGLPFNLVVKQLVDKGMPAPLAMLANLDPNSHDAQVVAEAFSIPSATLASELKKKDPGAIKDINHQALTDTYGIQSTGYLFGLIGGGPEGNRTPAFNSFMASTSRFSGDVNREYFNSIAATVQQMAQYLTLTQGIGADEAVKKSEDIIAARYDYVTITNNDIRVPKTLPGSTVQTYAATIEPEVATFDWDTKGYDKDYARELIRQGHWKNDNADHGLVWVDANGKLWNDKNGHPLSFSFEEARTGVRDDIRNYEPEPAPADDLNAIELGNAKKIAAGKKFGETKFRSLVSKVNKENR